MSILRVIFPVLSFTTCLWLWLLAGAEVAAQGRAWPPMLPPSAVAPTALISPTLPLTISLSEYKTYLVDLEGGMVIVSVPLDVRNDKGEPAELSGAKYDPSIGIFFDYEQGTGLYRSQSGGDQWDRVASMPEDVVWDSWLSLAPLFAQEQTLFAAGRGQAQGVLYRSTDGGRHWQLVLETGPEVAWTLVYAPNIEENRPIFLLASGVIYNSTDGGSTWQKLELPAGITPTALAISPTFAQDRLLFLGTADGQVVSWAVPE